MKRAIFRWVFLGVLVGTVIGGSGTPASAIGSAVSDSNVTSEIRFAWLVGAPKLPIKFDVDLLADPKPDTAVYDITAHVVVMPDGARLEAHSGLRERVDDVRFVREHMRGPTPPALYELAFREAPFHGIMALRLKPIVGEVFGRTGLLTHTYLLRGRPESNGCVVFRDYSAFLRAFREGRVRRLRVVPSVGEAALRLASL